MKNTCSSERLCFSRFEECALGLGGCRGRHVRILEERIFHLNAVGHSQHVHLLRLSSALEKLRASAERVGWEPSLLLE